jgi:hypothetical protein
MFALFRNQVFPQGAFGSKPINSQGFAPKDGLFGPKNLVSILTVNIVSFSAFSKSLSGLKLGV